MHNECNPQVATACTRELHTTPVCNSILHTASSYTATFLLYDALMAGTSTHMIATTKVGLHRLPEQVIGSCTPLETAIVPCSLLYHIQHWPCYPTLAFMALVWHTCLQP